MNILLKHQKKQVDYHHFRPLKVIFKTPPKETYPKDPFVYPKNPGFTQTNPMTRGWGEGSGYSKP